MTVMYTDKVATASFGCFLKLLARWRGSVYKLIWKELVVYLIIYFTLSLVYRFALNSEQRKAFEAVVYYCKEYKVVIQLSFILGFYVRLVMERWKDQFAHIPWPDDTAMLVVAYVMGNDDRGRLMRRTIMRYINLSYVLTMRSISPPVKKRFPTLDHMTSAGLMLPTEQQTLMSIKTPYNKYPVPVIWAMSIIMRARKEGRIASDYAVSYLFQTISDYRFMLGRLFLMDSVSIPIVYTQVTTFCTYMYFAFALLYNQFVESTGDDEKQADLIVPIGGIIQFLFYMGWLKVAEVMINPFGEDDDDFDVNAYIDRNWQFSYLVVDDMHAAHPELVRDQYWNTDFELPHIDAPEQTITDINRLTVQKEGQDGAKSATDASDISDTTKAPDSMPPAPLMRKPVEQPAHNREKPLSPLELAPAYHAGFQHPSPFDNRFRESHEDISKDTGKLAHVHLPIVNNLRTGLQQVLHSQHPPQTRPAQHHNMSPVTSSSTTPTQLAAAPRPKRKSAAAAAATVRRSSDEALRSVGLLSSSESLHSSSSSKAKSSHIQLINRANSGQLVKESTRAAGAAAAAAVPSIRSSDHTVSSFAANVRRSLSRPKKSLTQSSTSTDEDLPYWKKRELVSPSPSRTNLTPVEQTEPMK